MYNILPYSYQQAEFLGYQIKPSNNPDKKIDVYKNNKFITSIGNTQYSDFPHYVLSHGLEYAKKRRDLYKRRHYKDILVGSRGWLASNILW